VLIVSLLDVMIMLDELEEVETGTNSPCETHEEGTEQNDAEAVRFS
jgi:hypothetical protein